MKKYITIVFVLLSLFLLVACGDDKHTHEYATEYSYDAEYHFKPCTYKGCDSVYRKEKHKFDADGICTVCGYNTNDPNPERMEFYVTFVDEYDKVIEKQKVKRGEDAVAPTVPEKTGYVFAGWDKEITNITNDLTVKATYNLLKDEYTIEYNLNGGRWDYLSKSEYILLFLQDFYAFVSPDCTLQDFIYGETGDYTGLWSQYIGGKVGKTNRILKDNDLTIEDDSYFFNCTQYKTKWAPLGYYVKDKICEKNQRFANQDFYYGILDFYRYITNNPDQYIEFYQEKYFYNFPEIPVEYNTVYHYTDDDYVLPTPLTDKFDGWIDQNGKTITVIKKNSSIDYVLTAQWKEEAKHKIVFDSDGGTKIDDMNVLKGATLELPIPQKEGYIFIGWYINETKYEAEKFYYDFDIELKAKWRDENEVELVNLAYDGKNVTYRKTSTVVQIPSNYVQKSTQFRGVWVSSYAGDFDPSTNQTEMKATLTGILDVLDELNMNAIVFHIRTHNQAFYKTKMTYIASEYGTYESFEEWDYLTWFIDECHKRGIEFHAWLNPYRLDNGGQASMEDVTSRWTDYPDNPAGKAENILRNPSNNYAILDPAIPDVRDYIVDICTEIMQNYDVDAIHFDDYFYMTGIDDSTSFQKYNTKGLTVDNFRREQVNLFIEQLSTAMHEFNIKNNKHVQLGISPTGIYRNGDGTVEKGSNTSGYAHYGSPLYADTYKWIQNKWIDYILPQSYWAITHSSAGYADVMDWWNKACAGTGVNLYSGLGLYMSISGGNASWGAQPYEFSNQILYTTKLENCQGICVYQFRSLKRSLLEEDLIAHKGVLRVKNEYWTTKVSTPTTLSTNYTYNK